MKITPEDIRRLKTGNPPVAPDLLKEMTVGHENWLDYMREHYLENHISSGGSKVKVLLGHAGSGKTHLLSCVQQMAENSGYLTVNISARKILKFNDLRTFYSTIATLLDFESLMKGLAFRVAEKLGYKEQYDGFRPLLHLMMEQDEPIETARRTIRTYTYKYINRADLSYFFRTLCYDLISDNLTGDANSDNVSIYKKWFQGEVLDRHEKKKSHLYEKLEKSNARVWLSSLLQMIRLAGYSGLVIALDDLEALTERSQETGRYLYTPNAIKDVCEIIRQMIDDIERFSGLLLILSGRPAFIEDIKRGFKSYEALWMRLQSGLCETDFNRFSDTIDLRLYYQGNRLQETATLLQKKLGDFFNRAGYKKHYNGKIPGDPATHGLLRATVMNETSMYGNEVTLT